MGNTMRKGIWSRNNISFKHCGNNMYQNLILKSQHVARAQYTVTISVHNTVSVYD